MLPFFMLKKFNVPTTMLLFLTIDVPVFDVTVFPPRNNDNDYILLKEKRKETATSKNWIKSVELEKTMVTILIKTFHKLPSSKEIV